jgi:hypothetical protein
VTDDQRRTAYLQYLRGQVLTVEVDHDGKTYTVRYRPEKVVTASAKYGEDPPAHVAARLFREVIEDIRVDGRYAGRVDRLTTRSPALMEALVMAVGRHFIEWNGPVVARYFPEEGDHASA